MIGNLRDRWEFTWYDIWEPLGNLPQAPRDLYIQLYRSSLPFFRKKPLRQLVDEIVNTPELAFTAFQSIRGGQFRDEMAAVQFLEEVHVIILETTSKILLRRYKEYVKRYLGKYNLRYEVAPPFSLRVRLPAIYADIYEHLRQLNASSPHLTVLMDDFELSFSDFVRTRAQKDFKISLARASNYAEGIASESLNIQGGTLGVMCNQLAVWPHASIREAVKHLYKFCCDYPAIRHGGSPGSKIRDLEIKDTIIISALFFAASGYLHQGLRLEDIVS